MRGARGVHRAVHVLSAHGAPVGVGGDAAQPRQVLVGVLRIGHGSGQPAARLGHFLRPRAVAQALQRLLLGLHLRTRLVELEAQRLGVEHGQHAASLDPLPLVRMQFRDAAAAVEGQRDLSQVDIALEYQRIVAPRMAVAPPENATRKQQHDDDSNGNDLFLVHGTSICARPH